MLLQSPYMPLGTISEESTISGPSKIATCCYCGTRAALVLTGKNRHELSCSNCGAPLHDLKKLPKHKVQKSRPDQVAISHAASPKSRKKKKKKSTLYRVLDEAWDVIEDIFD